MSGPIVEAKRVSFRYETADEQALRDVNFSVREGEIVLLVGPTGCGKSTLLMSLVGIIPKIVKGEFSGEVLVDGKPIFGEPIYNTARKVGIVFQNPDNQLCSLTVEDEIAFGPENLGLQPEEVDRRTEHILELMRLGHLRRKYVYSLSAGEKQKTVIGSILSMGPRVILLDEPLSHLDPKSMKTLLEEILRLRHNGVSVVVAEHKLKYLVRVADRVVAMRNGEIFFEGKPSDALRANVDVKLGLRVRDYQARTSGGRNGGSMSPAVDIVDVKFRYDDGTMALRGLTASIPRGSFTAIVGNNGAGKSTLAMCIAGLLKPESGEIRMNGIRNVGYVFQNPDLMLINDSVWEEVAFALKNLKLPDDAIRTRVREVLESFDLYELKEKHPHSLSRGQRLKLAIASVVSMRPDLLILDEPTTGQDLKGIKTVFSILEALRRREGTTVVFMTHDLDAVNAFSEYLIVMENGRTIAEGWMGNVATRRVMEKMGLSAEVD